MHTHYTCADKKRPENPGFLIITYLFHYYLQAAPYSQLKEYACFRIIDAYQRPDRVSSPKDKKQL